MVLMGICEMCKEKKPPHVHGMSKYNPINDYHESNKWKATWADPVDIKQWLEKKLFTGNVLNLCCGQNYHGDIRVDVDTNHEPDVIADIHDLPFSDNSFDTVYVDPPFSLYTFQDGYWPREAWRVCSDTLILNSPGKRVNIPRTSKEWYVCEPKPGSSLMAVRFFQVFKNGNNFLSTYNDD